MAYKFTIVVLVIFVLLNIIAYRHAKKFTCFDDDLPLNQKTDASQLSFAQLIKTILWGINNPRPENINLPTVPYETIILQSNKKIVCWYIKTNQAKGTVILFHGYSGNKSDMLEQASIFLSLGYNAMVVDFMGSGGSEGNNTSIGYYEAEEVKTCVDYLKQKQEKNIILFGTSMGAVAIMKAEQDYQLNASCIILECPFGSMLKTIEARFTLMGLPDFPMEYLLAFWGGFQNNFNAFKHNPVSYAKKINCPTLIMYGAKDPKVYLRETENIFQNLHGEKEIKIYPNAGHADYLIRYKDEWTSDVKTFMQTHIKP